MGEPGPFGSDVGWRTPSARLWRMRVWEALVTGGLLAVLIGGGVMAASIGAGLAVLVGILVLSVASLWFLRRRFRAWRYLERAEDLVVVRGVMLRRLSVVPYGRMQFVDVTAGPVERLFGLATVKLHTAAAASDARVPGLEPAEAARLRDQLARLGEARAAGL